ncbi:MAG: hypothetical protein M1828_007471 [Chrysothrix sp. TS-e1954]|nr:MAG: hypothetical protein M1828_007471 [Chrysothrix sp. TS-e1954]
MIARCLSGGTPYGPPVLSPKDDSLTQSLSSLLHAIENYEDAPPAFAKANTSFSIEITSSTDTLWTHHHTADNRASGSTKKVTSDSVYRIASISKTFTVLLALLQQEQGVLSLEDSIAKWLPELVELRDATGNADGPRWENITLRSLASQLSGLPRESVRSTPFWDLANDLDDPSSIGFPPLGFEKLPSCDRNKTSMDPVPCSRGDFLKDIASRSSVMPSNYRSSYCNIAFSLLGLALESATSQSFSSLLSSTILDPLAMTRTSFDTPPSAIGVIPTIRNDWSLNLGHLNATGGLYSSSSDLSKFLRHILSNSDLKHTWLKPTSFSYASMQSAYGMPWEIYRTTDLTPSGAPVEIYTKAGGLAGYSLEILLIPDYDVGVTILTAGDPSAMPWLRRTVTEKLVPALEDIAAEQTRDSLAQTYTHRAEQGSLNSTVTFAVDERKGLHATRWISNGTDMLAVLHDFSTRWQETKDSDIGYHVELLPTGHSPALDPDNGLWKDRRIVKYIPHQPRRSQGDFAAWDDFCHGDLDNGRYFGEPVLVVDFLRQGPFGKGRAERVELPAFRVGLDRVSTAEGREYEAGLMHDERLMVEQVPFLAGVETKLKGWYRRGLEIVELVNFG